MTNDFLSTLKEKSISFKLTSDDKFGGGVSINDVLEVLNNIAESYNAFVEIEYEKISTQQDKNKLKELKKLVNKENELIIVDLTFESYGMAVSPNTITNNNSIYEIKSNQIQWKKDVFEEYKNEVICGNYNDTNYINTIVKKYNPVQRKRIFNPILNGLAKRKDSKVLFGINGAKASKKFVEPLEQTLNEIIPPIEKIKTITDKITKKIPAIVEITSDLNNKNYTAKPKVIDLFDEKQIPIISIFNIKYDNTFYELKYPLHCDYHNENDVLSLENNQIGIFVTGNTIQEVTEAFSEEFDYFYNRYNSLPEEQLNNDLKEIKTFLNLIVKK